MYTLIHYPICPYSRSIRLALEECDLEVRFEQQKPWDWNSDFLSLNPAGRLPVLKDGAAVIACGTYAISEYLSETGVDETGDRRAFTFFPGDEAARAEVRRLVDWFHGKFAAEVSDYLLGEKLHRRFDPAKGGAPDMELVRAGQANLRYHLSYIGHLTEARNWLAGEHLSFADIAAAAHLSCVDYLGDVPWEEAEAAKEWYARIKSRPSFRTLLADRIPGIKPPESYGDPDF
ncbi:MAG: glutathione S-transferase family protein [Alphaproteobacteria bacterium]|nr:MAG: glutathione S-transferase family protein [Alphaproteobacteria bacterium]